MRPVHERNAALNAGRRPSPGSATTKSFLAGVFATVHGEDCDEYAQITTVLQSGLALNEVQALAFAEYIELRELQAAGLMDPKVTIPLRLKLLDTMRKMAADEPANGGGASMLTVVVDHKDGADMATNRGPGAVLE